MSPWFWLAVAVAVWLMAMGTVWMIWVMRARSTALAKADERKRWAIEKATEMNRAMGSGVFGEGDASGLSDAGEAYRELVAKKRQEIGRQTGTVPR